DRHAGADRSAGRIDVQVDVLVRVFGGEQQDLRAQPVGDVVIDLRPQEDDALGEQSLVDRVSEVQTHRAGAHFSPTAHSGLPAFSSSLFTDTNQPGPSGTPRSPRVRSQRHFESPATSASSSSSSDSSTSLTSGLRLPKNSVVSMTFPSLSLTVAAST